MLRYFDSIAPSAAAAGSASSKTMNGALPPSSSETFFTVVAHWAIRILPISVEPVKVNLRPRGLLVSSLPTLAAIFDGTTLNTPGGMPARCASSASARAESGVSDGGLITKVQPDARAGAHLRVIIALGKFQGGMAATTPIGSFNTSTRLPWAGVGITAP